MHFMAALLSWILCTRQNPSATSWVVQHQLIRKSPLSGNSLYVRWLTCFICLLLIPTLQWSKFAALYQKNVNTASWPHESHRGIYFKHWRKIVIRDLNVEENPTCIDWRERQVKRCYCYLWQVWLDH